MFKANRDYINLTFVWLLLLLYGAVDFSRLNVPILQFPFKAIVGGVFLALFTLQCYFYNKISYNRQQVIFALYGLWGGVSIYWSYSPSDTITAIFGLIIVFLASIFIQNIKATNRDIVKGVFFASFAISASNLILTPIFFNNFYDLLQGQLRFSGYTYGAHAIARIAVILFVSCIYLYQFDNLKTRYLIPSILISLYIIYITDSRQAYIGVFLALMVSFYFYLKQMKYKYYVCFFSFSMIVVLFLSSLILDFISVDLSAFSRTGSSDEIFTLTGRTVIWETVIELISHNPFLGYGFGAGAQVITDNYITDSGWTTGSSHNSFLHSSLELGLFASLLLHILLFLSLISSWKNKDAFFVSISLFIISTGFIERSIAGPVDFLMVLILIVRRV